MKRLNRAIRYAPTNHVGIINPELNYSFIGVIDFSVSNFANNYNWNTQLGYIIFLVGDQNAAAFISFSFYKAR